jgi:CubicO group peptidase (beta-lactamase class C family)|tara:strand:- start:5821 stop:7053 length:1233 start_codon:yes stop_codon:yes gene_type:complete
MKKTLVLLTLSCCLVTSISHGENSNRPNNLTLSNFQFGPINRWSYSHIREILPTVNIEHDNNRILTLNRDKSFLDDFSISHENQMQSIDEIARDWYIDGLLILKNGNIVFEKYYNHLNEDKPHLMNSISKSVVGLLAGKIENDGVIDFSQTISHYIPELTESGWGPDSLQTVLDMKDGSNYTEDYPDFTTTFRLQDCVMGWIEADYCPKNLAIGGYDFFPTIDRNESNIGKFNYRSGSTDVIGWVLEEATGKSLATLISENIWRPMGAEHDAYITVDKSGFALASRGMNSTLRDLSRMGLLVLNKGSAFGEQVIPAAYIEDMHAQSGDSSWPYETPENAKPFYRSFWWGKGNEERDLNGVGIHGQFLRVSPEAGIVIAMYSSWPLADGDNELQYWDQSENLLDALVAKFR